MKKLLFLFALTAGIFMLAPQQIFAQDSKLSVHVKDDFGALIGASVYVKGTVIGAATDLNGNASFSCRVNATIIVSYIGYVTQEIPRNGKNFIKFHLKEQVYDIDPVIITPDNRSATDRQHH